MFSVWVLVRCGVFVDILESDAMRCAEFDINRKAPAVYAVCCADTWRCHLLWGHVLHDICAQHAVARLAYATDADNNGIVCNCDQFVVFGHV